MASDRAPQIVSAAAQQAFETQARTIGLKPDSPWVGGYVDYEWHHLRHILDAYGIVPAGLQVLEFGCNVGASAILLAHLGARVTALDIDAGLVELARRNAARYGLDNIDFHTLTDTRQLPFADGRFDLISCNSVLEYVSPAQLASVQQEIDRCTRVGGRILITGTSNRLWPREVHSGLWLVNYLPTAFDKWFGRDFERGLPPWRVRYGFGPRYRNLDAADGGRAFQRSRLAMGSPAGLVRGLVVLSRLLGVGPGMLANNISCLLHKQPAD